MPNVLLPSSQMRGFSAFLCFYCCKLNSVDIWTVGLPKQAILRHHHWLWETVMNIFLHFVNLLLNELLMKTTTSH